MFAFFMDFLQLAAKIVSLAPYLRYFWRIFDLVKSLWKTPSSTNRMKAVLVGVGDFKLAFFAESRSPFISVCLSLSIFHHNSLSLSLSLALSLPHSLYLSLCLSALFVFLCLYLSFLYKYIHNKYYGHIYINTN